MYIYTDVYMLYIIYIHTIYVYIYIFRFNDLYICFMLLPIQTFPSVCQVAGIQWVSPQEANSAMLCIAFDRGDPTMTSKNENQWIKQ